MDVAMAMVASVLLSVFRSMSAQSATSSTCILTGGNDGMGWIVRISRGGDTTSHGALVSVNRVLSVFTPYIGVAYDNSSKEAAKYDFVAYEDSMSHRCCHQPRKANKIIPPPEWPARRKEDIRDIAFWEISQPFEVDKARFNFLFPSNDDTTKIQLSIKKTGSGSTCDVTTFSSRKNFITGFTKRRQVIVSNVRSCENFFCAEGLCKLANRFDFCTIESRDTGEDAWERGAMLTCNGAPIGILGLNGEGSKTKGRNLFVNLLTAWEVFKRRPIDKLTTTTTATTTAATTTTTTTTTITTTNLWPITKKIKTTPTDGASAKETSASKKTRPTHTTGTMNDSSTSATAGGADAAADATTAPGQNYTGRLPRPPVLNRTTTMKPPFFRTVPKLAKPASGNTLVLSPFVLVLYAIALLCK